MSQVTVTASPVTPVMLPVVCLSEFVTAVAAHAVPADTRTAPSWNNAQQGQTVRAKTDMNRHDVLIHIDKQRDNDAPMQVLSAVAEPAVQSDPAAHSASATRAAASSRAQI